MTYDQSTPRRAQGWYKLFQLRRKAGLSQRQLAEKVGVHRLQICRLESGILGSIPADKLAAMCTVLGCTVESLSTQESEPSPEPEQNAFEIWWRTASKETPFPDARSAAEAAWYERLQRSVARQKSAAAQLRVRVSADTNKGAVQPEPPPLETSTGNAFETYASQILGLNVSQTTTTHIGV